MRLEQVPSGTCVKAVHRMTAGRFLRHRVLLRRRNCGSGNPAARRSVDQRFSLYELNGDCASRASIGVTRPRRLRPNAQIRLQQCSLVGKVERVELSTLARSTMVVQSSFVVLQTRYVASGP